MAITSILFRQTELRPSKSSLKFCLTTKKGRKTGSYYFQIFMAVRILRPNFTAPLKQGVCRSGRQVCEPITQTKISHLPLGPYRIALRYTEARNGTDILG